jgi:hypothetical protein
MSSWQERKSGKLIKILWHDGLGMSFYAQRLERGPFPLAVAADGLMIIAPAQLGRLLEGIGGRRRNLVFTIATSRQLEQFGQGLSIRLFEGWCVEAPRDHRTV